MRKLFIVLIVIIFGAIGTYIWTQTENGKAYAASGVFKREKNSGIYKICYYDCLGSEVAITIKSTERCPRTIDCNF